MSNTLARSQLLLRGEQVEQQRRRARRAAAPRPHTGCGGCAGCCHCRARTRPAPAHPPARLRRPPRRTCPATTSTSSSTTRRDGADRGRRGLGGSPAPRALPRRAAAPQQRRNLLVRGLPEVGVELPDGEEPLRGLQAHQLVDLTTQRTRRVGRAHRDRQHHPRRTVRPRHLTRRPRRRARRDPVVDQQRGPAGQRQPRPVPRGTAAPAAAPPRAPAARPRPTSTSLTCAARTTRSFSTSAPSSPTAPIASSGWKGTPSLRTTITSSGASSARATSAATGTPPRGNPSTTTSSPRRCAQPLGQPPARIHPIVERHDNPLRACVRPVFAVSRHPARDVRPPSRGNTGSTTEQGLGPSRSTSSPPAEASGRDGCCELPADTLPSSFGAASECGGAHAGTAPSGRTTTTGHEDLCIRALLTDPRIIPTNSPWPRDPTTASWQRSAISSNRRAG